MMGLLLWSENLAKLTLFSVKHGQHRAGCGDACMMGLFLWSENSAKLTLFCVQHGQHRAGCGVAHVQAVVRRTTACCQKAVRAGREFSAAACGLKDECRCKSSVSKICICISSSQWCCPFCSRTSGRSSIMS